MAGPESEDTYQENEALVPLEASVLQSLVENSNQFRGFLRRHLPDDAAAEDLLQSGLVQAFKKEGSLRNSGSSVAWFFRILRNLLIDHYRTRAAEARKHDSFKMEKEDTGEDFTPPSDAEIHAEVCSCMHRLLPTLKPEYGEVLKRIDLAGESPDEVAGSLGITTNNLSVRLHRARQALKTSLERTCGICTKHGCLDCTCSQPSGANGKATCSP